MTKNKLLFPPTSVQEASRQQVTIYPTTLQYGNYTPTNQPTGRVKRMCATSAIYFISAPAHNLEEYSSSTQQAYSLSLVLLQ